MKIAYLTGMATSHVKPGGYVHVTQVADNLIARGHVLYTNLKEESERFVRLTKDEFFEKGSEIDAFYIRLHGSSWNDELTLLRTANPAAPCIWEINAPMEELRMRGVSEEEIERKNNRRTELAELVDAAVCVSNEMEEYAREFLGIRNTYVVQNGTDPVMFSPEKREPGLYGNAEFVALWSGSPQYAWQGHEITVRLAERLKELNAGITVAITAEGTSADNLIYLGSVPYADMPRYMASADAGLCIYRDINFYHHFFFSPLKLYDYMGSGLPVIGSDVGQIKLVLEDYENGLLTNTTIDDLVEKLVFLKSDRQRAIEMGRNGRRAALRRHNWRAISGRLEDIIAKAVKARKEGRRTGRTESFWMYKAFDMERQVQKRDLRIAEYELELAKKDARMQAELAEKDRRMQLLLNSWSWKVTAPMRAAVDLGTGGAVHAVGSRIAAPFRAAYGLFSRPAPSPAEGFDDSKANLLIISRFVPEFDRGSGELRFFSVIRLLAQYFNITYIAQLRHDGYSSGKRDRYVDALKELGVAVRVADFNLKEVLKAKFRFAILEVYSIAEIFIDEIRARSPDTFIITDSVDVFFYREMRMAEVYDNDEMRRSALETRKRELDVYRRSDMVWTVTGLDRDILLAEEPGLNVAIVPNVHEMSAAPSDASEREKGVLVFVGGFRHRPNEDAVLYFCNEVLPLVRKRMPGVRLRVVGDSPPPSVTALRSGFIDVTGRVPDTMPYLRTSHISIAPLRYGAGLKGKIGEAMSVGLPVVTTSIGVQGMDARIGEDIMVGDTPEAFSDCILRLSEDEALYRSVSGNSFNYIRNNYSPEVVGGILNEIFLKIEEKAVRQA